MATLWLELLRRHAGARLLALEGARSLWIVWVAAHATVFASKRGDQCGIGCR